MIDIATLLTEVNQDAPCGPNLEYDPEFMALDQAARRRPKQQLGEATVAYEEPNWGNVLERALALTSRTKDLRVAMLITRALTHLEDVGGLAAGLTLIQGLVDRYWDNVHPRLDPEDGHDPTMRLNALAPLSDPGTLLREVRNMYLVRPGRHGSLAVRSVLAAVGKQPAGKGDATLSRSEIEGMLRATLLDDAMPIEALRTSIRTLGALRTLLADKVGIDRVPELKPLQDLLGSLLQVCDAALGTAAETQGQSMQVASISAIDAAQP
ncbi:MAG: type VI secretion system protein TssA, partial [Gammaproteobacteria bacterium]